MIDTDEYKKHFFYPFISKVYALLRNDQFVYERIKNCLGYCDRENSVLSVDPYHPSCNLVSVSIHEALHWLYPKWCETKVLQEEKRIMKNISHIQLKRLLQAILDVM